MHDKCHLVLGRAVRSTNTRQSFKKGGPKCHKTRNDRSHFSFLFVVVFFGFFSWCFVVLNNQYEMRGGRRCYIVAVGAAVTVVFAQHNYQSVASSAAGLVPFDSNCLQCIRFYSDNNQKLKNKKVASHDV